MHRIKQQKYIENLEAGQSNGFQVSNQVQVLYFEFQVINKSLRVLQQIKCHFKSYYIVINNTTINSFKSSQDVLDL